MASHASDMIKYLTEREYGERPRTIDVIDERLWGGLRGLVDTRIRDGSFGYGFPEQCPDGRGPCGCDRYNFDLMLRAEVPRIEWPPSQTDLPDTAVILDLLEFCASAVGEPVVKDYHSFFGHSHLGWNRDTGLGRFVADVNRLFARNGTAYEITEEGEARRLLPQPVSVALSLTQFDTGDAQTDRLLESARRRIILPKSEDRQDALEKLWDAFERLKTLEPGSHKRIRAENMLDRAAAPETKFRRLLGAEAEALTKIGNGFRIRHSEVTQEGLTSLEQADYLFFRLFALICFILKATGRAG